MTRTDYICDTSTLEATGFVGALSDAEEAQTLRLEELRTKLEEKRLHVTNFLRFAQADAAKGEWMAVRAFALQASREAEEMAQVERAWLACYGGAAHEEWEALERSQEAFEAR